MLNSGNISWSRKKVSPKDLAQFFVFFFVVFIILAVVYHFAGYKEVIPEYMHYVRLYTSVFFMMMLALCYMRVNYRALFFVNSVFLIAVVLLIKMSYLNSNLDIFGPSIDSYNYMKLGDRYKDLSYFDFLDKLLDSRFKTDDFGYSTIIYVFFNLFQSYTFVAYMLVVLNAVCMYFSLISIYRIMRLFNSDDFISKVGAILYGTSPYILVNISNGLKETVFVFIIIKAMEYVVLTNKTRDLRYLLMSVFLAFFCLFFRTAVFFIFLFTILVAYRINKTNVRFYMILFIIVAISISVVLPMIMTALLDVSLEDMQKINEARMSNIVEKNFKTTLSLLAAILGPFPNYDRCAGYAFTYSTMLLFKNILSPFIVFPVFNAVKLKDYKYIPMIIFIILIMLMDVVAGVSLDMRFHMPYIPFFFVLTLPFFRKRWPFLIGYTAMLIVMVYFYSTRSVVY